MPETALNRRQAFTLIEMLVVIAIIALLMGLVYPALTSAFRGAKINKAATETMNLAVAVEKFERDYGYPPHYPTSSDSEALLSEERSRQVVLVLMGEDQGVDDWDELNYKKTVYLDMDTLLGDGTLEDPWGRQYRLFLDLDLDQRIEYPAGSGTEYRKKALAISAGPDRDIDEVEDNIANVEIED